MVRCNDRKGRKSEGLKGVGLTHSRGVAGVMPCEFKSEEHSKGLALIRKGEVRHSPITELEYTMETMQRLISEIAIK